MKPRAPDDILSPPLLKCNSGALELPYKMHGPTITFNQGGGGGGEYNCVFYSNPLADALDTTALHLQLSVELIC
jgi:hypothetical protein